MNEHQPRMKVSLSENKEIATIEFLPASGASGSLVVSAEQLAALIAGLGSARAQMTAGHSLPSLENQTIDAVFNTRWYVQHEPLTEASLLSFYHPGYGPVGFLVPREQVAEMVRLLNNQVALPTAQGAMPN